MKFIFNKTDISLAMFGGTLTIFGKSGVKVSDASAETDEVFGLERAGIIEVHDTALEGVENKAPEPTFELSTPPTHGSNEYPGNVGPKSPTGTETETDAEASEAQDPVTEPVKTAKTTKK